MKKDKLTPEEQTTIDYYDINAQDWSNHHGLIRKETFFDIDMETFLKLIPRGKVLEVGSGHGGDAMKLINHFGLENYLGIDASIGLLRIAQSRNPGAKFLNRNIYDLELPLNSFDGFWISAVLVHVPKKRLQVALGSLHKVTKPQGFGFISIMEGESDMDEARPGRFFTLWKQDEFESELKNSGFKIVNKRIEKPAHTSPWLAYIVQRI